MLGQQQECARRAQVSKMIKCKGEFLPYCGPLGEVEKGGHRGYHCGTEHQGPGEDPHTQGVVVGKVKGRGTDCNAEKKKWPRDDGHEEVGQEYWEGPQDIEDGGQGERR